MKTTKKSATVFVIEPSIYVTGRKGNANKVVLIQGTDYDRKRKVTAVMQKTMMNLFAIGWTYTSLAKFFNVSPKTVAYNVDIQFNKRVRATSRQGAHDRCCVNDNERTAYKQGLLDMYLNGEG